MAERLLQHKHCLNCGKAVPISKDFCSEACQEQRAGVISRKRRQLMYLWIGAIAIFVLALFFMGGFG